MNQPKLRELELQLAKLFSRFNYQRRMPATPRSFKLHGMRRLLTELADPQLSFPVIHVAGTKGKGSVSTMAGLILTRAGYRTGVYTLPHLETIHQRLQIDGEMISDEQLLEVLKQIEPAVELLDQRAQSAGRRGPTFFEAITAAAFCHFENQSVDAVVLEVGLGGRLDTTNVCEPDVCVITNISLDHTKILGDTVAEIAFEKAGIIKSGVPTVSGATDPEAHAVIQKVADEKGSPLYLLGRDFHCRSESDSNRFAASGTINGEEFEISNAKTGMLGAHQATNATLAIVVSQILKSAGFTITDHAIHDGLANAHLGGRTEVVSEQPTIVLDMAHNVASVTALIETLRHQIPNWKTAGSRKLLLATSRDKDFNGMLRQFLQNFDEIVFCKYQNNPRGKDAGELQRLAISLSREINPNIILSVVESPTEAWSQLLQRLQPNDICAIAGSAFLVAELRPVIIKSL